MEIILELSESQFARLEAVIATTRPTHGHVIMDPPFLSSFGTTCAIIRKERIERSDGRGSKIGGWRVTVLCAESWYHPGSGQDVQVPMAYITRVLESVGIYGG